MKRLLTIIAIAALTGCTTAPLTPLPRKDMKPVTVTTHDYDTASRFSTSLLKAGYRPVSIMRNEGGGYEVKGGFRPKVGQ